MVDLQIPEDVEDERLQQERIERNAQPQPLECALPQDSQQQRFPLGPFENTPATCQGGMFLAMPTRRDAVVGFDMNDMPERFNAVAGAFGQQ